MEKQYNKNMKGKGNLDLEAYPKLFFFSVLTMEDKVGQGQILTKGCKVLTK